MTYAPVPVPSAQRSECARPSSPVPPPQRPFRRQCRSAASRTAGTSCRRQQPTGDSSSPVLRPRESPGRNRSLFPVSAAKRRKEQGSFSPAACTSGKIPLPERSVGGPSWMGLRHPSAVPSPSAKRPAGVRPGFSKSPLRKAPPFREPLTPPPWAAAPVTDITGGGGDLKGKQPKRRLWRKKRGCFEAAARLAAPNRGRQSECRNGADEVPSLSAQLSHFSSSARSWSAKWARLLLSRPRERLMASMTICPTATSRS